MSNVEITSQETIKPSAPTPPHFTTHKLSWIDRIMPNLHVTFILIYQNPNPSSLQTLKTSLSQTLSLFYPLAGRLNPAATAVDCNDAGINLFTASITSSDNSAVVSYDALLPCGSYCSKNRTGPLVSIQLTTLASGALAIGTCFCHKLVDAHSATAFITAWAAGVDHASKPVFDGVTLFPPPYEDWTIQTPNMQAPVKPVTKRFLFSDSAIAAIRGNMTRVQAIIALLWRCCVKAKESRKGSIVTIAVNMRGIGRMNSIPAEMFGNVFCCTVAAMPPPSPLSTTQKEQVAAGFEKKVKEAIAKMGEEKVKRLQEKDGCSAFTEQMMEAIASCGDGYDVDGYHFTSWSRFGLVDVDFGWGKPSVVGTGWLLLNNTVVLVGRVGGGIEAYVGLGEEEMGRFEKDEEIVMHSTCVPLVVEM